MSRALKVMMAILEPQVLKVMMVLQDQQDPKVSRVLVVLIQL